MELTLTQLRADFEKKANRSMSMPIAGLLVWCLILGIGQMFPTKTAIVYMLFASGLIFPLALLVAKYRQEDLFIKNNPLGKLIMVGLVMANTLWVLHILLMFVQPQLVPYSLSLALAIHWPLYGWIIQDKLGSIHLMMRAFGLFAAFLWLPFNSIVNAAIVTILCYAITLVQMSLRSLPEQELASAQTVGSE